MANYVTDTMALILYLEKRKMGAQAKAIYTNMTEGIDAIYIPTFVLAELLYLSEKQRINVTIQDAENFIHQHDTCYEYPLNLAVIKTSATVTDVPELHDRLISATAVHLQHPLITNDPVISKSQHVKTVW